jgi:hypothetical protein
MIYFIKRKIWQIKNVIKWLPIIWKQYDFDYSYSLEVFKFQLQKQAEFLESNKSRTQSASYNSKRIRTILKLMDKVYNQEYSMEYQNILKEKYGDNVMNANFVSNGDNSNYLEWEWESWDNADEISKIKDDLFKISQEKQDKAHKLLWKLIEHNIQGFWD